MKVLMLVTKRQRRGAEVSAWNLSRQLQKLGVEIVFAGIYENQQNELVLEGADNIDFGQWNNKLIDLKIVRALVKLIHDENIRIVQANGSDTLKYAVAAKFSGAKIKIVYRNISIISTWVNSVWKKRFYTILFGNVDKVVSVGEKAKQDFTAFFNYPAHKIESIHRGIPIQKVISDKKNLLAPLGLASEDLVAMHVGSFSAEKNHRFLINAWKLVVAKKPNASLLLVGEGATMAEIQKQVSGAGMNSSVRFLGYQANVQEWLHAANLCCLCSLVEGVPGVLLEAGAQKRPSVAVNVGGVSEAVEHGVSGILIDTHDEEAFATAVVQLFENEALQAKMGENAYELVKSEFDEIRNAQKFIAIYKGLGHSLD